MAVDIPNIPKIPPFIALFGDDIKLNDKIMQIMQKADAYENIILICPFV